MKNFKQRWQIKSNLQLIIILLVFALTGSTAAYLSKPILGALDITKNSVGVLFYYLLYVILIFPIYQLLLLLYGWILGQFRFFYAFEKKMLTGLGLNWLVKRLP
jgi:hypothetical protein